MGNGKCGRAVSPSCIEELDGTCAIREQSGRSTCSMHALTEACDKQWAQQKSSNTAVHKHILQAARTVAAKESARHTVPAFIVAAVDNWSCESHRHLSAHRRIVKKLHRCAKHGVREILPAMVEAMSVPAEVLKLRLHSRRLPEQLDHARSNELGSMSPRSLRT